VRESDVISVKGKEKTLKRISDIRKDLKERPVPKWLAPEKEALAGTVKHLPRREDLDFSIQEQLIVELYSK